MIRAYVEGFSTHFEGEDLEINYAIFQEDELIEKEQKWLPYDKPALVGLLALNTLLEQLNKYKGQRIQIMINDAALYELMNDTSTTQNSEVVKLAKSTRRVIATFGENMYIDDISYDYKERKKFAEVLKV